MTFCCNLPCKELPRVLCRRVGREEQNGHANKVFKQRPYVRECAYMHAGLRFSFHEEIVMLATVNYPQERCHKQASPPTPVQSAVMEPDCRSLIGLTR